MNIFFLRIIDRYFFGLLNVLFFWLKYFYAFKSEYLIKNPNRILIIRLWALGSSLLCFSMIKKLKDNYDAEIDLLVSSNNFVVFKNQGYHKNIFNLFNIKDLVNLFLNFKKYDIVIDSEEYFRTSSFLSLWLGKLNVGYSNIFFRKIVYLKSIIYDEKKHALLTYLDLLKPLGINYNSPQYMESFIYQDCDKQKVDDFLVSYNEKIFICMHTGGSETAPERFWSINNWVTLINLIFNEYGDNVIVFLSGAKSEEIGVQKIINSFLDNKYTSNIVNVCGNFNLYEFSYFLKRMNIMISNDTGPMHLSASMGTKTIGLFGPNLPIRFGPYPLNSNYFLYKGSGVPSINVHLGEFDSTKEDFINKILPEDVLNIINDIYYLLGR